MQKCLLLKRPTSIANNWPSKKPSSSPTSMPSSSSSFPSSSYPPLSLRRTSRIVARASSEDFGLQWQPVFRFEQADLMAEAPSLLKACEDFDWKSRAIELRALAKLSLQDTPISNSHAPKSHSGDGNGSMSNGNGDRWFAAGITLVTAALTQCSFHFSAFAAEEGIQNPEAAEAASRAPAWLTPALLAFPVVSYAIFNVYRDQVNPYAKVTDWMFGVVAFVIVANLVLISTIGVRLY